jgi:hypothetical protein
VLHHRDAVVLDGERPVEDLVATVLAQVPLR